MADFQVVLIILVVVSAVMAAIALVVGCVYYKRNIIQQGIHRTISKWIAESWNTEIRVRRVSLTHRKAWIANQLSLCTFVLCSNVLLFIHRASTKPADRTPEDVAVFSVTTICVVLSLFMAFKVDTDAERRARANRGPSWRDRLHTFGAFMFFFGIPAIDFGVYLHKVASVDCHDTALNRLALCLCSATLVLAGVTGGVIKFCNGNRESRYRRPRAEEVAIIAGEHQDQVNFLVPRLSMKLEYVMVWNVFLVHLFLLIKKAGLIDSLDHAYHEC